MKTRIFILYNYKLYKLTIIIYVYKYILVFFLSRKMFFMISSKRFISYFYNYNKNLHYKFEFLEN